MSQPPNLTAAADTGGSRARRLATLAGTLLALAGLVFVGMRLWALRGELADWRPTAVEAFTVVQLALIYGIGGLLLSVAWWRLLVLNGWERFSWPDALAVYGRSQLAKYVPGNVMHIAGRHALARAAGVSHGVLALAAVQEIVALLAAAALVAALAWTAARGSAGSVADPVLAAGVVAAVALLTTLQLSRRLVPGATRTERGRTVAAVLALHAIFLTAAGVELSLLTRLTRVELDAGLVAYIVAAHATAWALGFITPGAPGGLGVREAVLVTLLGRVIPPADALGVALAWRVVTTLGDVAFFCGALPIALPGAGSADAEP